MVNQTITVIYHNEQFLVNFEHLYDVSRKFKNLINQNEVKNQNYSLQINYNKFNIRNISNFLKICQDQQTDVQNSEMKEICLIAKMFQADKIYNTALNFIHHEIDETYTISPQELIEINRSQNLILESETYENPKPFQYNLDELDFEENIETINNNNNINANVSDRLDKAHSICYQIKIEKPIIRCHRFYLLKDNKILYTAKQKYDKISIGEGKSCHINQDKQISAARITRNLRGYNIVSTYDQQFKISYLKDGEKFLIKTSFDHKSGRQNWQPMQPKSQNLINGEYDHKALNSKRNIILKSHRNRPVFIVRKMSKKVFEVECHPDADPVVTFSIALSQIVGPIGI